MARYVPCDNEVTHRKVTFVSQVERWQAIGFLIIYGIYVACVLLDHHIAVLLHPWFPTQTSYQTSDWDNAQLGSPSTLAFGSDSDQSEIKLHRSDDEDSELTEETPFGPFSLHREDPYMYGTPNSDISGRSTFSLPTPRLNVMSSAIATLFSPLTHLVSVQIQYYPMGMLAVTSFFHLNADVQRPSLPAIVHYVHVGSAHSRLGNLSRVQPTTVHPLDDGHGLTTIQTTKISSV